MPAARSLVAASYVNAPFRVVPSTCLSIATLVLDLTHEIRRSFFWRARPRVRIQALSHSTSLGAHLSQSVVHSKTEADFEFADGEWGHWLGLGYSVFLSAFQSRDLPLSF